MPAPEEAPSPQPAWAALRHRGFAFLWGSRLAATFAAQMVSVAVGWRVYDLTRNPFDLGMVGLVQFASALRYPVFNNGKNYSGSSPKMTASALLRDQLLTYTAVELASLQEALVLPLGPAVTNACHYLTQAGKLDSSRVIEGIPHPSGANGERIAYFLGRKEKSALSAKTDPTKIDAGRQAARKTVTNWRSKF